MQRRRADSHVGPQTTPIVVDGVIYLNTPGGGVIAVDGATGASKWKWQPTAFENTGNRRGVSVGDGKVFALADGNRVVALDKDTGRGSLGGAAQRARMAAPLSATSTRSRPSTTTAWSTWAHDGNRGAAFAVQSQ